MYDMTQNMEGKKVKTDGLSEENLCVDIHQCGDLKSVENCYSLTAAGCLMKY